MTLQCKRCFLWPVGWNHDIRHFAGHVKKPVNPFLVIFMFQLRNFMLLLCVEGIYLISWSPLKKKTSVDEVWNVRCPFLDSQGFHPTVTIFIFNHFRDEMKHTNALKPLLAENINDCTYCSILKTHWQQYCGTLGNTLRAFLTTKPQRGNEPNTSTLVVFSTYSDCYTV